MQNALKLVGCIFGSFAFLLCVECALDAVATLLVRARRSMTWMTSAD